MIGKCPGCGNNNVRRTKRLVSEMTWRRYWFSPYYCRDCKNRFLVFSTNTYYLGGMLGVATVGGVIGWYAFANLGQARPGSELAPPAVENVVDTTKLAEKNDPLAEYTLAQMYAQGRGVPKNEVQAQAWLERAAQHGNPEAQYEIGMAVREGRAVVQDYQGAFRWLQLAADNGNARAQFELGYMYRVGMGMPVDNVKAYVWFNIAAARGNADAVQARIAVLPLLSRSEVVEAQGEARRLIADRAKPSTAAP
jgi:hypothetical protein